MKLKKYNQIIKEDRKGFDDIDDTPENEEGYYYGDENEEDMFDEPLLDYKGNYDNDDDDTYDDVEIQDFTDEEEEAFKNLTDTIRNMIARSGMENFYVNSNHCDIVVQFVLHRTERFSKMMHIMGMIKKISSDILIQYNSEVDLWETKTGEPLFTVNFYWNPNKKGSTNKNDIFK